MENTYKLILVSGANAGAEFSLEKDELYLGRDVNNDIVINDPEVSRRHARLVKQEDDYYYEDLGSTNGSFIRDQKLSTLTLLRPDTTIMIGEKVALNYQMKIVDLDATRAASRKQQVPVAPPPAFVPPSVPVSQPPLQTPPPPQTRPPQLATGEPKKMSKTAMTLLIIAAVILVFCVIPWIIMEVTASYCNFFGGIFNIIQPGSCP
jgi:hypothetical protein